MTRMTEKRNLFTCTPNAHNENSCPQSLGIPDHLLDMTMLSAKYTVVNQWLMA